MAKARVIGVRGKEDAAEELHTEARSLCTQAALTAPDNAVFAKRVFTARRDRAHHHRLSGNYAGTMEDARRMVSGAAALVQRFPDAASRDAEVEAAIALAAAHGHLDQLEEAHQQFLRAQSPPKDLAAGGPGPCRPAGRPRHGAGIECRSPR